MPHGRDEALPPLVKTYIYLSQPKSVKNRSQIKTRPPIESAHTHIYKPDRVRCGDQAPPRTRGPSHSPFAGGADNVLKHALGRRKMPPERKSDGTPSN